MFIIEDIKDIFKRVMKRKLIGKSWKFKFYKNYKMYDTLLF